MKILKEILIILTICMLGEVTAKFLPISFPSSVISLIILLILLIIKVIRPYQIKQVSEFLLHNMAFFFIPAGVYILGNYNLIRNSIAVLLAVCLITTIITFIVTAYTVMLIMKVMTKMRERKN